MYANLRHLTINGLTKYSKKFKKDSEEREVGSEKLTDEQFTEFAHKTKEVLIHVKGVWPFDLFPDEATLDRQKFVVKRHILWGVSKTQSAHHDDILDSNLSLGPIFGSVTVHMKYVTNGEETINWLTKENATRLHIMLQGLLSSKKNGMDLTPLSTDELKKRLMQMGQADLI